MLTENLAIHIYWRSHLLVSGSEDMLSKHRNDEVIGVATPAHSLMGRNVLNYIMQIRFLQFLKS